MSLRARAWPSSRSCACRRKARPKSDPKGPGASWRSQAPLGRDPRVMAKPCSAWTAAAIHIPPHPLSETSSSLCTKTKNGPKGPGASWRSQAPLGRDPRVMAKPCSAWTAAAIHIPPHPLSETSSSLCTKAKNGPKGPGARRPAATAAAIHIPPHPLSETSSSLCTKTKKTKAARRDRRTAFVASGLRGGD